MASRAAPEGHERRQGQGRVVDPLKTHQGRNLPHRPIGVNARGQVTDLGKSTGELRRVAHETVSCLRGRRTRSRKTGEARHLRERTRAHGHLGVDRENLPTHIGSPLSQGGLQRSVTGFGVRKHHIKNFEASTLLVQGQYQVGHGLTRPRPCAHGLDTFFIDIHHHQPSLGTARTLQVPGPVVASLIKRLEHPRQAPSQSRRHTQSQHPQQALETQRVVGGPKQGPLNTPGLRCIECIGSVG